jgi:excisionase family DNA binding protein
MSNLRRVPYTKPVPEGAEIVTKKGERFARFKRGGKTVEAPLNEDGTRIRLLSKKWYGEYTDADGRERCVPLFTDKTASEQELARLVREAELGKAGVVDPFAAHRKRPLAEHLRDFAGALRAKGDTAKHVDLCLTRLRAALDGTGAVWLGDLDAGKVGDWLVALRADREPVRLPEGQELFKLSEAAALLGVKPAAVSKAVQRNDLPATGNGKARRFPRATVQDLAERSARGVSAETVNHYVRALRAFGHWLDRSKRWPSNPFDTLAVLNAATDRRHDRRELAADEMRQLLAVTRASSRSFRGLTGPDRAALYLTACGTGFRVRALAGLTPADFDLAAEVPAVVLPARLAKNKKAKVQPLAADVADALRAYLDGRPANAPVWPGTWNHDAAEMLRADLEATGIPYTVEGPDGPLFADFHALRHTYLTLGGRSGIDLRTLQELAGHSNPNLTARYSHRRLHDLAGAVEKLPSLLPPGQDTAASTAVQATGTEGGAGESLRPACATIEAGRGRPKLVETEERETSKSAIGPNPLPPQGVGADCDQSRVVATTEPAGARTQDLRINLPRRRRRKPRFCNPLRRRQVRGCPWVARRRPCPCHRGLADPVRTHQGGDAGAHRDGPLRSQDSPRRAKRRTPRPAPPPLAPPAGRAW